MTDTDFSLAEVSRLLGVPQPTLRSWEQRHAIAPSPRVPGKHRRYASSELRAVRVMRDQISQGHTVDAAAGEVRRQAGRPEPGAPWTARFVEGIGQSDPSAMRTALHEAHDELGLGACLDEVVMPLVAQLRPERWSVPQLHLAREVASSWLRNQIESSPAPHKLNPVVLACSPTEYPPIGLEAFEALLREDRQACRLLDIPASIPALIAAVTANQASAVVIVSQASSGRPGAVRSLEAAEPLGVPLFYAGASFYSTRHRRNVPGQYLGRQLQDATALLAVTLALCP